MRDLGGFLVLRFLSGLFASITIGDYSLPFSRGIFEVC